MANFESSVKVIPYSQERVYAKLSSGWSGEDG